MEVIEEDHDEPESEIVQQEEEEDDTNEELKIVMQNPFKLEYVTMKENPFVYGLEEQKDNEESLLEKLKDTERRLSKEMDQIQNLIGLITNSQSIIGAAESFNQEVQRGVSEKEARKQMMRRSRAGNRASRIITNEVSEDLSMMIGNGLGIEEVKQQESEAPSMINDMSKIFDEDLINTCEIYKDIKA